MTRISSAVLMFLLSTVFSLFAGAQQQAASRDRDTSLRVTPSASHGTYDVTNVTGTDVWVVFLQNNDEENYGENRPYLIPAGSTGNLGDNKKPFHYWACFSPKQPGDITTANKWPTNSSTDDNVRCLDPYFSAPRR